MFEQDVLDGNKTKEGKEKDDTINNEMKDLIKKKYQYNIQSNKDGTIHVIWEIF